MINVNSKFAILVFLLFGVNLANLQCKYFLNNLILFNFYKLEFTQVIIGTQNGYIQEWFENNETIRRNFSRHDGQVTYLKLITNDLLASGSSDKKIKLWNFTTGSFLFDLEGHLNTILCLEIFTGLFKVVYKFLLNLLTTLTLT